MGLLRKNWRAAKAVVRNPMNVKFYVTAACLFGFVSFCASMAIYSTINYKLGADYVAVAFSACLVFVLLTLICVRLAIQTYRRGVHSAREPISVGGFRCPVCESTAIMQLPANAVSPFASFECGHCGAGLVRGSTKLFYFVVAVLAIALIVFLALFGQESLRTAFKFGWIAFVVLGYCVRQLMRKSIRRIADGTGSTP
jgi:hypothetical protein